MIRRKSMTDKKLEHIISGLSTEFGPEERETSILFDHPDSTVHLETTVPATARRWYKLFKNDPNINFDINADSFKLTVPSSYCRPPELILKPAHRVKQ